MDAEIPTQQEPINAGSITTSLTPEQFYQGDPYLVLVKDKLHLDNIWSTAIFFVIAITYNFSVNTIFSEHIHPTTSLSDAFHQLLLAIAYTSFYLIYLLLPKFMAETFDTLRANGVIGNPRQDSSKPISYESFVEKLRAWTNSPWWLAIIAMLTILYWLQVVFVQHSQIPLFWNVFFLLVGVIPGIYLVCFILVRVVLLLVFINRLFSLFTIQVKLLHADGSGGLGSLGRILWISVGMMFAISLAILAAPQAFASPVAIFIITVSYLVLVLALVIGCLALPHHIMLLARQELLKDITKEYEQAVEETMPSLKCDTAAIEAGTKRLSALQERYKLLRDNFPVWPLEIMQMRRLGVAFIVPVLLSLLPSFLNLFTGK